MSLAGLTFPTSPSVAELRPHVLITVAGPWGNHTPLPFYPTLCGHPEVVRGRMRLDFQRVKRLGRLSDCHVRLGRDCDDRNPPTRRKSPMKEIPLKVIGVVRNGRDWAADSEWGAVTSIIEMKPKCADGLKGLEAFSHALILFYMHRDDDGEPPVLTRRPRGRADMP